MRRMASWIWMVAPVVLCTSCSLAPPIETAADLTHQLEKSGLVATKQTPLDFSDMKHAKIEEGVQLTGDDFTVDIIRIEDRRTYNVMKDAKGILIMAGSLLEDSAEHPPELFLAQPFVIVVRREPSPGHIRAVLEKCITFDEEN